MSAVGGYELLGRVGVGSTATVWKARDEKLSRDVALKQVGSGTPDEVDRLRREAAALAALSDDHIVEVFGFFEEDGSAYLVEQWIDGATLAATLAAGGQFSPQQALGVSRGALLGLSHAHSRGVVHGDVSTGNILIDTDGVSRLIDFGRGESGTPAYRSPEVAIGEDATVRSDVFAAGAVLVHLLTGSAAQPPAVGTVDSGLRPVLAKALSTDPADRYADAAEFLAALEQAAITKYGAAWWTQAGVGALVAPGIAALTAVGGGGAAVATATAGAGTAAAPGSIAAAEGAAPAAPAAMAAASPVTEVAATAAKSSSKMWIIGGVAAAVVLVGGGVAVANRGGDDTSTEGSADSTSSSSTDQTAEDTPSEEAEPEPTLEELQPTGVWDLGQDNTKEIHRDGSRKKVTFDPATWTFTPSGCTETECSGAITSSGGAEYTYVWSGAVMTIDREPLREPRAACVDTETGEAVPIEESSASAFTTWKYPPFQVTQDATGKAVMIEGSSLSTTKFRFFGTCEPGPKDIVGYAAKFVVTPQS